MTFEQLRQIVVAAHLPPHPLGCAYVIAPVPAPPPGVPFNPAIMPSDWEHTFGEVAMTVTMALIGAALAMLYFAFHTRWVALVGVLLAGYLAHFASKAFQLMGEFGYMAPFFAGWLAPLLLLGGVIGVLFAIQKKRGLGTELGDTPHYADATSE